MAVIKSALELALEKTEGLSVDKEELRRKELFTQGRVAAAKGLEEGVDSFETALLAQEKALKKPEYAVFADGAADNLLSRIVLAFDPAASAALAKAGELLDRLTKKKASARLQKIAGMLQQYGTEVGQLRAAIGQQLNGARADVRHVVDRCPGLRTRRSHGKARSAQSYSKHSRKLHVSPQLLVCRKGRCRCRAQAMAGCRMIASLLATEMEIYL